MTSAKTKHPEGESSGPLRKPFDSLRRVELLALAGGVFALTTLTVFLQPVVVDPDAASSLRVRFFSPTAPGEEAVRPVLSCSLNAVDVVPPQDVWIVGNRGLVLHSADSGRRWKPVVMNASPSPAPVSAATSAWPGILPVVEAAPSVSKTTVVEERFPVGPGANAHSSDPGCLGDKSSVDPSAACIEAKVALPSGARPLLIVGTAAEAKSETFAPCTPACAIGWSSFVGKARVDGDVVVWRFKNWSHDRNRVARIQVEYDLAPPVPSTPTPDSTPTAPAATPIPSSTTNPAETPAPVTTPTPPATPTPAASTASGGSLLAPSEDLVGIHFARSGSPGRGWIVARSGAVFATDDSGASWRAAGAVGEVGQEILATSASEPPVDDARAALIRSMQGSYLLDDALWSTDDDGRLYRVRRPRRLDRMVTTDGRPLYGLFFASADSGWAVGKEGRIFAVTPGAASAAPLASGSRTDLYSVAFLPDGRGWAVGAAGTILASADSGKTWANASIPFTDRARPWSARLPFWYGLTTLAAIGLLFRATRAEDPPERDESIADTLGSDRPVESGREDVLDFQAVARGLSRFLRNEKTTPPLTIAVIGEWGTGKSSLMNLLRADLHEFGFRSVWFNAWHHQKEEHLLAALLQTVRLQAVPPAWSLAGLNFRRRLMWRHVKRHPVLVGLVLGVFVLAAGYENTHHSLWKLMSMDAKQLGALADKVPLFLSEITNHKALGLFIASAISVVLTVIKLLRPFGVNPASLLASVSGSGQLAALEAQTSFRHLFAQEFQDVTRALGTRTMPIFIDDLDRCRPQQVVDVLEAVSFLVSSGECFVVLGMARDRVEKCVGMSFKEVADEMAGPAGSGRDARSEFARQYLDKLINIEVPIQEPTVKQSAKLLITDAPARARNAMRVVRGFATALVLAAAAAFLFWVGRQLPAFEKERTPVAAPVPVASLIPAIPATEASPVTKPAGPIRRPAGSWPPIASADETGVVGVPPRRSLLVSYAIVWPLSLGLIAVCAWVLNRRRDIVVKDSAEFRTALETWHPVVVSRRPTPRALKRFVNRLRYLAMRQRPNPPSPPLWRTLLDRLIGTPPEPPASEAPAESVPESALVALASLDQLDPMLVRKPLTAATAWPPAVTQALGKDASSTLLGLERYRAAYLRMSGKVQVN